MFIPGSPVTGAGVCFHPRLVEAAAAIRMTDFRITNGVSGELAWA